MVDGLPFSYPWFGSCHDLQKVDLGRAPARVGVKAVVHRPVARGYLLLLLPVAVVE